MNTLPKINFLVFIAIFALLLYSQHTKLIVAIYENDAKQRPFVDTYDLLNIHINKDKEANDIKELNKQMKELNMKENEASNYLLNIALQDSISKIKQS